MQNFVVKYKNIILLTIGILLIILSICLVSYDKMELIKKNVFDEVSLLMYRETNKDNEENTVSNDETNETEKKDEEVNDLETNEVDVEKIVIPEEEKKKIEKEFIGYLEINKVNLKQGLVSKKSYYNNVNRNIQILDASDYPDKEKGNTILAAHSGTSSISYFKNLYKLVKGDSANIYYKGYIYSYNILTFACCQ